MSEIIPVVESAFVPFSPEEAKVVCNVMAKAENENTNDQQREEIINEMIDNSGKFYKFIVSDKETVKQVFRLANLDDSSCRRLLMLQENLIEVMIAAAALIQEEIDGDLLEIIPKGYRNALSSIDDWKSLLELFLVGFKNMDREKLEEKINDCENYIKNDKGPELIKEFKNNYIGEIDPKLITLIKGTISILVLTKKLPNTYLNLSQNLSAISKVYKTSKFDSNFVKNSFDKWKRDILSTAILIEAKLNNIRCFLLRQFFDTVWNESVIIARNDIQNDKEDSTDDENDEIEENKPGIIYQAAFGVFSSIERWIPGGIFTNTKQDSKYHMGITKIDPDEPPYPPPPTPADIIINDGTP